MIVPPLTWDPFSAPTPDPYPLLRALRDSQPVYHNPSRDFWALTRYEDVRTANREWETFSYADGADIDGMGQHLKPGNFLGEDPPCHTALRGIVRDDFRPGIIRERFATIVQDEVQNLLRGRVGPRDDFDVGEPFAWELPIRIASHFLGFPAEDCRTLRAIADQAFLRPAEYPIAASAVEGARAIRGYFEGQIVERRRRPQNDLLTRIATSQIDGKPIGDVAAGIASNIFGGAVDTVALTLTNAVYLLGQHPDQRAWLVRHKEHIGKAVEEVLRLETPVQVFKRTTTADVQLHGTTIPSGRTVILHYGSANRDERRFERPDELDLGRENTRHLAFGDGVHHCIGAPLARLETEISLQVLLSVAPEYELTGALERVESSVVRGFRNLWIRTQS